MSDQHLRFNPSTLQYEVVKKAHSRWRNVLYVVSVGIAFAVLFIVIGSSLIKSNKDRKKEHELAVYKETYENIEKQYQADVMALRKLEQEDQKLFKDIFETDPPDTNLLSNALLADPKNKLDNKDPGEILNVLLSAYARIEKMASNESLQLDYARYTLKHNNGFIQSLPIRMPLKEGTFTLVSGFGKRIHPIFKTSRDHKGVDFAARAGTPVLASGEGIVQKPPANLDGYGNVVFIYHGNGYYSLYAQLLEVSVKPGQKVAAGEIIGSVGSTGISIGPHLHYEIWRNNQPVDPVKYILNVTPHEYQEMLKIASQYNQCLS